MGSLRFNNSFKGRIRDRASVVVDNKQLGFLYHTDKELTLDFANDSFTKSGNEHILDLIVENMVGMTGEITSILKGKVYSMTFLLIIKYKKIRKYFR